MFGRRREIIGIDLGSGAAKAVVLRLEEEGKCITMREHVVVPTEYGGGRIALERTLAKVFGKLRTRSRDCAITMWPDGAKLRLFDLGTAQGAKAIASSSPAEVQRLFPEKLTGYVSVCSKVESCRDGESSSMCVAEAVPQQTLHDVEAVLRNLGRRLRVLQLTPLALLNAFTSSCLDIARDEPYLVADFGRERALIVAGYQGLARAVRVVDFPWESIITSGKSEESAAGSTSAEKGMEAMQTLLRELVDVCDYLDAKDESTRLSQMHVSGVLSSNPDAMRTLGEALDVKCVPWNPLSSVTAADRGLSDARFIEDLRRLPLAAGVALQYAA